MNPDPNPHYCKKKKKKIIYLIAKQKLFLIWVNSISNLKKTYSGNTFFKGYFKIVFVRPMFAEGGIMLCYNSHQLLYFVCDNIDNVNFHNLG